MKKVVSHILQTSAVEPVIILQADHGSASTSSLSSQGKPLPEERLSILNAFYVSGAMKSRLYPEITPVNTFRILLNSYFDEPLDPLKDRMYFSWYDKPYDSEDVTEQLVPNNILD
jgi:hypothetical protein